MADQNKYQDHISKADITQEIWFDVIVLCIIVLFLRSIFLGSHGDHWFFGPVLDGANYITGTALAAIIIVSAIPDRMRRNISLISSSI